MFHASALQYHDGAESKVQEKNLPKLSVVFRYRNIFRLKTNGIIIKFLLFSQEASFLMIMFFYLLSNLNIKYIIYYHKL